MARQAQITQNKLSAQGVKSGAFGGSRQGVQAAETDRNLADISSKRIFEDYFNNYAQAQKASMEAWNSQQTRAQTAGTTALGAGKMIGDTALNAGTLEANAANNAGTLQGNTAAGIAALGTANANLGREASALAQGDTSFLYNVGEKQQQQRQNEIDANRKSILEAKYEPFQNVSFLSDIYKNTPSSQQTISQTTAPSASLVSQATGVGTTLIAANKLAGP